MTEVYLARIDILAFSAMFRADPDRLNKLLGELFEYIFCSTNRIREALGVDTPIEFRELYGDTIDLICHPSEYDDAFLLALVELCIHVQSYLMENGLLVRGAIIKGDILMAERMFTGSAMVSAHELESGDVAAITVSEEIRVKIEQASRRFINDPFTAKQFIDTLLPDNKINYLFRDILVNSLQSEPLSDTCFDETYSQYLEQISGDKHRLYCENTKEFHSELVRLTNDFSKGRTSI